MKTFIRIVSGKNGADVEEKVNGIAQEQGVEIASANSFMWQGVIYTTVVFKEAPVKYMVDATHAIAVGVDLPEKEVQKSTRAKKVRAENG
jgi:hypothetical protein